MIPHKVRFTGLEFEPADVADRWHRGVIPEDWSHSRFTVPADIPNPVGLLNQWLFANIEGRWAIWVRHGGGDQREVNLAFETDTDGVAFILADGKTEAFRNADVRPW